MGMAIMIETTVEDILPVLILDEIKEPIFKIQKENIYYKDQSININKRTPKYYFHNNQRRR